MQAAFEENNSLSGQSSEQHKLDGSKKSSSEGPVVRHDPVSEADSDEAAEDARLEAMGYKNEFKREFRSLSTFSEYSRGS